MASPAGGAEKLPFQLQQSEQVQRLCRRHWMYLYPKLLAVALAGIVPIVVLTLVVEMTAGLDGTARLVVALVDLAWAILWLVRGYFTWYRYQNDIWVVTNQRIVDSVKRHWFHHRMASADLVDIEDIAVVREGLLPTLFNFGDLRCQTAGEVPNFVLSGIPEPAQVLATVDARRDAARRQLSRPDV
jgi:hypothetical protein